MNHEEKLPVRIVRSEPRSKERKPGGGSPTYFFETEEEFLQRQKSLIQEINHVQKYFQESFQKYPQIPHVSKVQLVEKAIAKSHRPTYLFYKDTCPIIGAGNLGQLFVRTELKKLHYLRSKIEQEPSAKTTKDKWKANISAVSNFNPFTENDRLKGETPESLIKLLEHDERFTIKVKLFDFFDSEANLTTKKGFISLINQFGLSLDEIGESVGLEIWKIEEIDIESLKVLATFPAIQELSLFPRYKVIQPSKKETTSSVLIPTPEPKEYPVVGLLDTGIPENHFLSPWVIQSSNFVDPRLSNRFHGCTVGSLLVMAHYFNDSLDIDNDFLKILNVEILGNTDADYGRVEEVFEDELIRRMEYYFRDSGSFPRIWNMSLGFLETCEFKKFSDLAIFLDKLQDKHGLLFVLPSGNYNKKKFRIWPPKTGDIGIQQINENDPNLPPDYLSKPADCIRAITVGAIACDEKKTSLVNKDQPTSYSRKGPGPSFIPKPEVVHYSGNVSISKNGEPDCTGQGIKSLDNKGRITDCAGTSYAAPLVSRTLAFLSHYIESGPSPLLLKAFLVHNARMLKSFGNFENCFYYVGFGLPAKAIDVLFCSPYEITLIFEDKIKRGEKLEYPFEWPDSLKNGNKIKGEVKATLVSTPPLNEAFGAEYVRADVRFSLQSKTTKKSTDEIRWEPIVPEDPCKLELKKRYESNLIKEAFKWSPVKRYYKKFHSKKTEELKIKIELFLRDGPDLVGFTDEVPFVLIFTLRDPQRQFPVYDEVISKLHALSVITEGIRLRGRARKMVR